MRQTTRQGDPGQNFRETAEGEKSHSVEVSINAKGEAQIACKLYYETVADMATESANDIGTVITRVARRLTELGVKVAGWPSFGGPKEAA